MTIRRLRRLSADQRATLDGLGDVLIPRTTEMPSASDVGIGGHLIDAVLVSRDDLAAELIAVLDAHAGRDPAEAILEMQQSDRDRLSTLRFVVAGGYLMHDDVKHRIGYPGQAEKAFDPYGYVELVESGLLDPVVARGPIYRPSPAHEAPT